ncbi:MAG: DUF1080 domain-containing protein [Gemmataceae bacterium]|nr:DUF1080 domain-containing protein [Gemmataceae bacterium]MDW8265097.1 DUF1080 domain-containing protein [Gemmataceae bacterium]
MAWRMVIALALGGAALLTGGAEPTQKPSALESQPMGWLNLLPDRDFKDWVRVPLDPDNKLSDRNPWSVDADRGVLVCKGKGIKEMLLYKRPFANGIFHVEWRFLKEEGMPEYNSGIYVRTLLDGKIWTQVQLGQVPNPPLVGDIFGLHMDEGKYVHSVITSGVRRAVRPPGEWNTAEVTCKGKEIEVWLNGAIVCRWTECPVAKGHVGVQAELFDVEFRNLKFKPFE